MADDSSPELADLQDELRHLDASPDPLHMDLTPAVLRLIQRGAPAARAVLPLLDAPQRDTRLHAQRVLEGVVMQLNGFKPGQGYADPNAENRVRGLLVANGNYHPDLTPDERRVAIRRWSAYFDQGGSTTDSQGAPR